MKLKVAVATGALAVGTFVAPHPAGAEADPVLFDFEAVAETPPGSHSYTQLEMTEPAITVTLHRSSGAGFDIRNVSVTAPDSWGARSLSPFGDDNPDDEFLADFSVPATEVSIEFGDAGRVSDDDSPVTLTGFDAQGEIVASVFTDWGPSESMELPKSLVVSGSGIVRVAFSSGGPVPQTMFWDNLAVTPETNTPPDCSAATPSAASLWPPRGDMVPVTVTGVTDADGDVLTLTVDAIHQDEPTASRRRDHDIDGDGRGTDTADLRAEREGRGNGRVYHVTFTANDGNGGSCTGVVQVQVPVKKGGVAVDDGPTHDSTA